MQRASLFMLVLLIPMVFSSCEYEPKGIYMVDVVKPGEAPPLEADLNILTDTIYFYWASSVRLKLSIPGNKKILFVKSFLDDGQLPLNYDQTSVVTTLNSIEPGIHKFKMTIITNTGTGSLADIYGAELYQYDSREWTLIAEELNTNLNISHRIDENGLNFSWKEYDGLDFKSYRIKELSTGKSYDLQGNSFVFPGYAGEQSYFDLYVIDSNNKENLWGRCLINKSLPALRIGSINNKIALMWNATPFRNNHAEYRVFQRSFNSYTWNQIGTLSNSDTSILLNTDINVFAPRLSFYLYCVPKGYSNIENTSSFSSYLDYVTVALPGPKFDTKIGADCAGFYFYNYSSSLKTYILYRYTESTDQVTTISNYKFFYDVSPNAKYLSIPGDSIIQLYDLVANHVVKSVNVKKVVNGYYPGLNPQISDNGICIFISGNIIYAYDLLNEKLIASKKEVYGSARISPQGKYILFSSSDSMKIYRVNDNSLTFVSGTGGGPFGYDLDFFKDQDDYFYHYDRPFMKVISSQDFSVVRSMNIGEYFFNVDFCSGKILTAKNGSYWDVYDFNTGQLLQTVKTEIGTGGSNYTLLNQNTIYFTGYKYYLNE